MRLKEIISPERPLTEGRVTIVGKDYASGTMIGLDSKLEKFYGGYASTVADAIIKAIPAYRAALDLPDRILVLLGVWGDNYEGVYRDINDVIRLQVVDGHRKKKINDIFDTLSHELVHVEQFRQGRLARDDDGKLSWHEDVEFDYDIISSRETEDDLKRYKNLPREAEANERSPGLTAAAMSAIA